MADTMVTVEATEVLDDGTITVSMRVPTGIHPPLAPASLYDGDHRVLDVDAVVHAASDAVVVRTKEPVPSGTVGRTFRLQQWWRPDQLDAVTDARRTWARTAAPPPEHHEHCLLDWETIEAPGGRTWGWRSDDDWLCEPCYRRYIVDDELGLRP